MLNGVSPGPWRAGNPLATRATRLPRCRGLRTAKREASDGRLVVSYVFQRVGEAPRLDGTLLVYFF